MQSANPRSPVEPVFRRRPRATRGRLRWAVLALVGAALAGLLLGSSLGVRGSGNRPNARATADVPIALLAGPSPAVSVIPSPTASTYVVAAGDTMRTIAAKVYGDAGAWPDIYAANRDTVGPDPDALLAGTRLRIPPR